MDLSHDPHRGALDDIHVNSQDSKRDFSRGHQSTSSRYHRPHSGEPNPTGSLNEDSIGDSVGDSNPISSFNAGHLGQQLSYSWLLVLFTAPVIIVLLVWLLILLRRRVAQSRHLVSFFGCSSAFTSTSAENDDNQENLEQSPSFKLSHDNQQHDQYHLSSAKTSSSKIKSQRQSENAHYLLESSSSNTSTSSSGSLVTDECSPPLGTSAEQRDAATTATTLSARTSDDCQAMPVWQRRQISRSAETMRALVDHTSLFLLTLTYQEIVACLVALTIAILNVIRMRNLFCCNLVIFALITSRLLNLLTLTTFSLTKLIKLFKLQVAYPISASGVPSAISTSTGTVLDSIKASKESKKEGRWRRGAGESVACRLLLLLLTSSFLALVFLYLRLNPSRGPLIVFNGDQTTPASSNRSSLSTDWSISIFAPSTTTEASTRYTSGPDEVAAPRLTGASLSESNLEKSQQQQQQQPNYLASWSARFQQSSSLRHLLDQYELQNFVNLLFDTQLQTSRFTCTLAASNYAPVAKVAMLAIYCTLMIAIVIAGIAIQQVGRKRLSQFKRHKLSAFGSFEPVPFDYDQRQHYQIPPLATIQEPSTDSNRKRYTDLLRQTIRHQSSLEMSHREQNERLALGGRRAAQGTRQRLRNASSMSSLLAPHSNSSASVERIPQHHLRHLKHDQQRLHNHLQQQLLNSTKYPANQRYGNHLRRLMNAQSMANLTSQRNTLNSSQNDLQQRQHSGGVAKISGGKFGGSQLAWLPLSSAATVASLSNIGRESESAAEQSLANGNNNKCPIERDGNNRCARSRLSGSPPSATATTSAKRTRSAVVTQVASWCQATSASANAANHQQQQQQQRERLVSIGEHLVDFVSLDERDEKEAEPSSSATVSTTVKLAADDDCPAQVEVNVGELAIKASSKSDSSREQQQIMRHGGSVVAVGCGASDTAAAKQSQSKKGLRAPHLQTSGITSMDVAASLAASASADRRHKLEQPMAANEPDWPPSPLYSNQRQQVAARNGLYHEELKRDLRLAQSVILFGQLLNHAPILILLAMANLLPDGLMAGWNSSHDNGFVWLTLIEAMVLPVLLCAVDSRLARALRRSLSCRRSAGRRPLAATSAEGSPFAGRQSSQQTSSMAQVQFGATGARLAHFNEGRRNQQVSQSELVLGPSASYPDFMFVCPAKSPYVATNTELRTASAGGPKLATVGSLTGPPYPLLMPVAGLRNHEQPLAIDTNLRDTNFALSFRPTLRNTTKLGLPLGHSTADCIGTADLMASRRARYAELLAADGNRRRKRARRRAAGRSAGSAILSATRRLLSFGRPPALGKRQPKSTSKYGYAIAENGCNSLAGRCGGRALNLELGAGTSGSGGRGMSPTSSLSTLIRKFNHDNYTSVCQQYEQRKKEIEQVEQEKLAEDGMATVSSTAGELTISAAAAAAEALLIDGLDGPTRSLSGGRRASGLAAPSSAKQSGSNLNRCLLDEEGMFCRKGGLCYNYCLDDSQDDFIHLEERSVPRINPLLHTAAGAGNPSARLIEQTAGAERVQTKIDCPSKTPLLAAEALQTKLAAATASLSGSSVGPGRQTSASNALKAPTLQPVNSVPLGGDAEGNCGEQQLDTPDKSKVKQSIFMVPIENIKQATSGKEKNNGKRTDAPGKSVAVDEPVKSAKVAASEQQQPATARTNDSPPATKQVGQRLKPPINSNNEPIISNITSVQELLDKMNGIISDGQTEERGSSTTTATTANNSNQPPSPTSNSNRAMLACLLGKGNANNDKRANTCANQLRQLELSLATSGRHNSSQNNNQNSNTNTLDRADYASLRSIEDTLSLVSVSSEFEYHNINGAPATTATNATATCKQRATTTCSTPIASKSDQIVTASASNPPPQQQQQTRWTESNIKLAGQMRPLVVGGDPLNSASSRQCPASGEQRALDRCNQQPATDESGARDWLRTVISPVEANTATATSIEAAAKRLDDLKFPSFLPLKAKFNEQPAATGGGGGGSPIVTESMIKSAQRSIALNIAKPPNQPTKSDPHLARQMSGQRTRSSQVAATSRSSSTSSSGSSNRGSSGLTAASGSARPTSSSLLNLTSAKFAAALSGRQPESPRSSASKQQHQSSHLPAYQLGRQLPTRSAGSSSTITKQRGRSGADESGAMRANVTLAELASQQNERSLPAGGGNVRARIRKMEQQSTPNLNLVKPSQPKLAAYKQVPAASGRPTRLPGSLIPVTTAALPGKASPSALKQVGQPAPRPTQQQQQRHLANGDQQRIVNANNSHHYLQTRLGGTKN